MSETDPTTPARRHLITIGAARYRNLPDAAYLPQVDADTATVAALIERFGYRRALAGLGEYATAEHLRRTMSHWSQDAEIGSDDIVAVYYAGHGLVDDRHYLLC
ncbi:caspase family protein [Micromonospora nigra]|uniref:caspase family protein n=1 Tax=Micromonospora nigra TaxID=145857 RepID=UPI000B88C273|nr:caspase family protein [Micromonospora nigra]